MRYLIVKGLRGCSDCMTMRKVTRIALELTEILTFDTLEKSQGGSLRLEVDHFVVAKEQNFKCGKP